MEMIKPIPIPQPNESENDFMERCITFVMSEGTGQEQAVAICSNQWYQGKKMIELNEIKKKAMLNHKIIQK